MAALICAHKRQWRRSLRSRRNLLQQLHGAGQRADGVFRVLAFFKAHGSVRAELEPRRRLAHRSGRKRSGFQHDALGRCTNRRVIAADDSGNAHGLTRIGDDNIFRTQRILLAVQGENRLAFARGANNDRIAQQIGVVGVHGLAEFAENVVRDVNKIVNRVHAQRVEPILHPQRRRRDFYVLYALAAEARAEIRRLRS